MSHRGSSATTFVPKSRSFRLGVSIVGGGIVVLTLVGLVTGADWLTWNVAGSGLPLGNLALAVSFVVLPGLALPQVSDGMLRVAAVVLVLAGLLWFPVSAWLAGNLRLDFVDAPGWWWPTTLALPCSSVLLWFWIALRSVMRRWRGADRRAG